MSIPVTCTLAPPHTGVEKILHPPLAVDVGWDTWGVLLTSFLIDGAVLTRATSEMLERAGRTDASLAAASIPVKMRAVYSHLKTTQVCGSTRLRILVVVVAVLDLICDACAGAWSTQWCVCVWVSVTRCLGRCQR
jgi:hypothetical protein